MHYEPKCLNGVHVCPRICISDCKVKNPFICDTCKNHHGAKCEIIHYRQFIKRVHVIQGLNKSELYKYEDKVETTFRELIKSLQKEFLNFREQFQLFNATQEIIGLYALIRNDQPNAIPCGLPSQILQLHKLEMIDYKIKSDVAMRSLKNEILEMQSKVNKKLPFYYNIKLQIEEESVEFSQNNEMKELQKKYVDERKFITSGLLEHCIDTVESFIGKEIYNIQVAFRASEHNFLAAEFHKVCNGMSNTLTILKTQFGNILGGYCALPWKSPSKWEYYEDPSAQTFIFSASKYLSHYKFTPLKKNFSIAMHRQYGPCFGEDVIIYDKANRSKMCWSNFPDVYTCKDKQIPHTIKVIKQFVGVDDHFKKFNLLEWEVYKISFSKSEEIERSFMEEYRQI